MLDISVVIPIYNALDDVKLLLDSLVCNFDFKIGEVILLNDCSNEETTSYLKKFSTQNKDFCLIENKENLGFIKTCNKGMKISKGKIVVLLNSDTIIPSNFVQRIIDCFESDKKIGIASPVGSFTADFYVPMPKNYNLEQMNDILNKKHECVYPVLPSCEGFCYCIRKDVIEQQGYLDEIFGAGYCEEIDYSYRAITNGWLNVLIDNLYVYHKRQASFGNTRREILYQKNMKIFYSRWGNFREDYIKKINYKNPIRKIRKEMFTFKHYYKKFKMFLYSKEKYKDKTIYHVLGTNLKFKRNDKVIYTCITGDYDYPQDVKVTAKGWDYICFTDNKELLMSKKVGIWKIRPLIYDESDNERNVIYHKIFGPLFLKKYNCSLWIDNNLEIRSDYIYKLINGNLNQPLFVPVHYQRDCIYEEVEACMKQNKDDVAVLLKQKEFLKSEGMPEHYGLCETNLMFRLHGKPLIEKIMFEWWQMVEKFSKRDQLSFTYVLWKNNIKVHKIVFANCANDIKNFGKSKHCSFKKVYKTNNSKFIKSRGRSSLLSASSNVFDGKEKYDSNGYKKILLISHNLHYEGAPISLFLIAKILKKNNYNVTILSPLAGDLYKEYYEAGIPVEIIPNYESNSAKFKSYCKNFDLIIANTILTYKAVDILKNKMPVIWLIREANNIMDYCKKIAGLNESIKSFNNIYSVSEYAKEIIDNEFNQNVKVLHNFSEDLYRNVELSINDKISFTYVGTMIPRKGLNVLINAFLALNEKYADKIELNIIGELSDDKKHFWEELQQNTNIYSNIFWHDRVIGNYKINLYEKTSVFVVPSLDESSSRIVLEGCMMARPVIVTENVGAKYMINDDKNCGWIVKTNNINALKDCMENIILNPITVVEKGKNARQRYLETSTMEIYEKNLLEIVKNSIHDKSAV